MRLRLLRDISHKTMIQNLLAGEQRGNADGPCNVLLRTKQVSDATFQAATKAVGEGGVVDLIWVDLKPQP